MLKQKSSTNEGESCPPSKCWRAGGERSVAQIVMATHAGMTTQEFEQVVQVRSGPRYW